MLRDLGERLGRVERTLENLPPSGGAAPRPSAPNNPVITPSAAGATAAALGGAADATIRQDETFAEWAARTQGLKFEFEPGYWSSVAASLGNTLPNITAQSLAGLRTYDALGAGISKAALDIFNQGLLWGRQQAAMDPAALRATAGALSAIANEPSEEGREDKNAPLGKADEADHGQTDTNSGA